MENNYNNRYLLNQQQIMMHRLQQLQFAVEDLALYLDTHPNDKVALFKHRRITAELKQLKDAYEAQYGPLCIYNYETQDTWRYINGPWPWDSKYTLS